MILRPVRADEEDAEVVRMISAAAFGASRALKGDTADAAHSTNSPGSPDSAGLAEQRWLSHTRHLAGTDPGGCWIAENATAGPVGVALSARREGTWGLSLLAVVPGAQGKGVGKALMARSLVHGRACLRGIISGSRHPMAARTYRRAPDSPCTRRCG